MTSPFTLPRTVALLAAVSVLALAPAGTIAAQGAPAAARVPRDTQPALREPVSPSRPPSAVAPSATVRAARVLIAEDVAPRPPKSPSMPVYSAQPAPVPMNVLDPRRAPAEQPAPPVPVARRSAVVEQRASVISDIPPDGATVRCKDGTFVLSPVDASSCSDRGGVAVVLPQRQVPRRPIP